MKKRALSLKKFNDNATSTLKALEEEKNTLVNAIEQIFAQESPDSASMEELKKLKEKLQRNNEHASMLHEEARMRRYQDDLLPC